jgi:hypothetical protein
MTTSLAHRFVVAYTILVALEDLSVLLPGNPYTSVRGFVVAVGIQALIVWRLWHGSTVLWVVAMAFAVLTVVTLPLMQLPLEPGVILMFVLSVAQVLILWMYALAHSRPLAGTVGTPPKPFGQ